MKFLDGNNVKKEIKNLVGSGSTLKIAVAYWGKGATRELGLDKLPTNSLVTVICDLMSGACNPKEISCLRKHIGNDAVKQLDGLHAKVWLTENGAIIGSSNASANGLGFEGNETNTLIEANFFIKSQVALNAIDKWFDNLKPKDISPSDLKRAEKLWKENRIKRPNVLNEKSVLEAIQGNHYAFDDRNFFVWIYDDPDLDRWAQTELKSEQKLRGSDRIECWQDVENPPPGGSYILAMFVKHGKVEKPRLFQVLQDDPLVKTKSGTILLCKPIRSLNGMIIGEPTIWKNAAIKAAEVSNGDWEGDIATFAKMFL